LGARPGWVLRSIIQQGLVLAVIGGILGIITSVAVGHLLSSLIFGLRSVDAIVIAAVVLVLTFVSVGGGYFPARRAALVDPLIALRASLK
jgi:ABC-type antimicrobial peptide transport system permease subunit